MEETVYTRTSRYNSMTPEQRREALINFEQKFHEPIWQFIVHKIANRDDDPNLPEPNPKAPIFRSRWARKPKVDDNRLNQVKDIPENLEDLEILDISEDSCVFTDLLAAKYKVKRIVSVTKEQNHTEYVAGPNHEYVQCDLSKPSEYDKFKSKGPFDVIVLKEVLYQLGPSLQQFLLFIHDCLKPDGLVFTIWRPPVPPVPVPNVALPIYKQMSPTHEEVLENAAAVGLKIDAYAAACPIFMPRDDWGKILTTKCLPAVRNTPKCTTEAIADFIGKKPETIKFEERLFLFVFWLPDADE